jgi:6-phosphogluconolactonase/glucosamine-6-phosphate isomerase/deaminase
MRLIIRDEAGAASTYVAQYIIDRIKHFNPSANNPFVLGLPTGSSPIGVYKILVEKYKAGEVSFPLALVNMIFLFSINKKSLLLTRLWDGRSPLSM